MSQTQSPIVSSEDVIICPAEMPIKSRKAFLQQMVDNLPETVHNRIMAMKNIQLQQIRMSEKFFRDVYALEKAYYERAEELFEMRKHILTGQYEPKKQEKVWKHEEDEVVEEIKNSPEFQELTLTLKRLPNDVRGVPRFWLTVFRNVSLLSDWVQDHDEPLLARLIDIRIKYEHDAYTFEFWFEPNDYLQGPMLSKKYFLRNLADDDNPFIFEGPEIYKCEGCCVPWREGKDLTKTAAGARRKKLHSNISKLVPRESFFRFFTPPAAVDLSLADEKTKLALGADFEVGYLLRTQIVPKAVLFYTGDIVENINEPDYNDNDDCISEEEQPSSTTTKSAKHKKKRKH